MNRQIAIDGPAGAGKSTIAKRVAGALGYLYVDTGAMYRAIGLYMQRAGIESKDRESVREALRSMRIDLGYENGEQQILLNEENVNAWIRTPEIGAIASEFAALEEVRESLMKEQREIASKKPVVMDGRDIGTKVLPEAEIKIFLTADVKIRAQRRHRELLEKGEKVELSVIEEEIGKRDEKDMTREVSPLVQAKDAILLDTSNLSIEEVVNEIIRIHDSVYPKFVRDGEGQ